MVSGSFPSISLSEAILMLPDPEALKRGYFDEDCLPYALALAVEIISSPFADNPEYRADVGSPHQWWEDTFLSYRSACAFVDKYKCSSKRLSNICLVAQRLVESNRRNQ
jgi:hypothetical protein